MLQESLSNILPSGVITITNKYYDPELLLKVDFKNNFGDKELYLGIVLTSEYEFILRGFKLTSGLIYIDNTEYQDIIEEHMKVFNDSKNIDEFKDLAKSGIINYNNSRPEISTFSNFINDLIEYFESQYIEHGLAIPSDTKVDIHISNTINKIRNFIDTYLSFSFPSNLSNDEIATLRQWFDHINLILDYNNPYEEVIKIFKDMPSPPEFISNYPNGQNLINTYNEAIESIKYIGKV